MHGTVRTTSISTFVVVAVVAVVAVAVVAAIIVIVASFIFVVLGIVVTSSPRTILMRRRCIMG